ncbi:MAG: hypothetical protein AAF494_13740, partial [Pseudomonadota bacterium]
MKHVLMTTAAGAALLGCATLATTATAKVNADWIEKISISKNGIDTRSVKVMPRDNRYSELQTTAHRFLLAGHVKAKKRKKIARVTWQSKENPFFAQGANKPTWEQRALIRHGLRETNLEGNQTIELARITWVESPEAACEKLKASKMTAGMSEADVLGQAWSTHAKAAFFMKADVIRKNDTLNDQNYDTETASMS